MVYSLSPKKIPSLKQLKQLPRVLSLKEKKIVGSLSLLILISLTFIAINFYQNNFLPVPTTGGEYTEGLIGAPQYINPILSQINDVDSDISKLLFSGLLKYDSQLQLVPDLAKTWEISDDQKTYTFTLRPDLKWHDNEPLTADDIIFTVKSIQDPDFKSPLLVSLRGVTVEKINDQTVKFVLPNEPYPSFAEVLTFGILPEHIWGEIPPINANLTEYNLKPIGSGPWKFKSLAKDRLGNIKSYTIVTNPDYYGQKPYLEKIIFKFYPDFQTGIRAVKNNSAEGLSFLPKDLRQEINGQKNLSIYSFYLPQYTAIFFNQKENEDLKDKTIRKALSLAVDKSKILSETLNLEGEIIDGPILPELISNSGQIDRAANFNPKQARELIKDAGWEEISVDEYQKLLDEQQAAAEPQNDSDQSTEEGATENSSDNQALAENELPLVDKSSEDSQQKFYLKNKDKILTIRLTTVNQPENIKAAGLIKQFWQDIGVKVDLIIVDSSKISREVIKPRNYQVLLFGIIVGSNPDPYPFWHSSQIQDPGLNLSLFANRQADKLLEDARQTTDKDKQKEKYQQFQDILSDELPAIFLYNPTYTYIVSQKIKGINIDRITIPSDRFNNLSDWYIKTTREYKGGGI